MDAIVAVYADWGIGADGTQPVVLHADRKRFREATDGVAVIVGRKTLEDFPGGRPLKGRHNIVLTTQALEIPGAEVVHTVEEAAEAAQKYEQSFVIGGASVYAQLLPYCDTAHITKIDYAYQADAWFPNLDEDPAWEITADSDEQTYFDLTYRFLRYQRVGGLGI